MNSAIINHTTQIVLQSLTLYVLLAATLVLPASASTISLHDQLLVSDQDQYTLPSQIIITPIFAPDRDFQLSERDWVKGIIQYSVERLGFPDAPFHYFVSPWGNVYEGNSSGEEARITVHEQTDSVIIGYLANRGDSDFNPRAKASMGELILGIANRYAISLDDVVVQKVKLVKDEAQKVVRLETEELFGGWHSSVNEEISKIASQYNPIQRSYTLEVSNVVLPESAVNIGDAPTVKIDVTNTSDFAIYAGTNGELLAGYTGEGSSRFFVNDLWASNRDARIMSEGQVLQPGETTSASFRLATPLYFDGITEQFMIRNRAGQAFDNTRFDVTLNINRPSERVVEILSTELGYLRVRQGPSTSQPEIARLTQGERFIVLENLGNGWIKLDLGNGNSGWVSQRYTRTV